MDDSSTGQARAGIGDSPATQLRVLVLALAVAGAGLLAGVALTLVVVLLLGAAGVALGVTVLIVVSLVLTQGVAFGGVALGYVRWRGLPAAFIGARVPSLRDVGWVVGGYVLALAGAFVGATLSTLLELEPASNQIGEVGIENPELLLLLVPLSVLLIGPGEELLFRGVVQGTVRQAFGPVPGVVLASAIFAAVHYFALTGGTGGRLVTIAILFLPSLVFGTAYEVTDNLVVPALVHGIYNATLFGAVYVAIRMGGMPEAAAALL